MTEYQGENFKRFLKINKIKVEKAAKILDKNRVTVYQYFKSKNLTREVVSDILTKFGVSENEIWGESNGMNTNSEEHILSENNTLHYMPQETNQQQDNIMRMIDKYINSDDKVHLDITPVYDRHVTVNKVSSLSTGNDKVTPDLILLNGAFKDCELVIRHTDPALNGFLSPKSFIGLREIKKESYTKRIIPGKAYVIVLDNLDVIERFVHPGKDKSFLLKSNNPLSDPDFEIDFDEILELWLIKISIPFFDPQPL
jgi:plasmid maintenance system antidote protein VapI